MKKLIVIVCLLAMAGFTWFVWFKAPKPEEPEAKVATEVPVQVGEIMRTTLRAYVTAYGTVEPEPAGERPAASARVAASVSGVVASAPCAEGQHVQKGALLFQLDSRTAEVATTFAARTVDRQKKLLQGEATSQKTLQDAEQQWAAARAQQALLQVQSPLAGTVVRVNVRPGEAVDLTTVLAEVVDLDRLVVMAHVPSFELPALKVGQSAEVRAEASSGSVTGAVVYISPEVDPKAGTAAVRVSVPVNSGLRPGQFVNLRVVSAEHKDCLAVPATSVVQNAAGASGIALVQGVQATQKPVKVGLRDGALVEIEGEGLQAGMVVVTEGAYGLPKQTKVRVLEK